MKKSWLVLVLLLVAASASAQTLTVLDADEEPVAYAKVACQCEGEPEVTRLTNSDGRVVFGEAVVADSSDCQLKVAHIAYASWSGTVAKGVVQTIQLEASATAVDQVVITAQYAPAANGETMHKIKVIDRKTIDAMGAVNLGDVLRNEVNTRIGQDNVLGSSVSLQGLSGQNVKILVDGVPMIGRQNGNLDLGQINLNDIERIEVVEGPLSVSYGTDALAGAINLITRKVRKDGLNIAANTYFESAGQYNADARVGFRHGRHQLTFSGGRNFFDGWSPLDPFIQLPKARLADTLRSKPWNLKTQYFSRLQYEVKLGKFSLRPSFDYFEEEILNRGLPRSPYFESAFDDTYRTWRQNIGLQGKGTFKKGKSMQFSAAINGFKRIKNTYFKDLTTLAEQLSTNDGDQDTSKFRLFMVRGSLSSAPEDKRVHWQLGYDVNVEEALGARIATTAQEQSDLAMFGSAEIELIDNFRIRPGLRYAYNSAYDAPLVPSVHAKYRIEPKENQKKFVDVSGSWSRGFRAPSLKELYFEFVDINHNIVGNEDLLAEYSDNFQLNIDGQTSNAQKIFRFGTGGFYNRVDNLITLAQSSTGPEFTYVNIGNFQTLGVQAKGHWQWEKLTLKLDGAYVGRYNEIAAEESVPAFSFSPELRGQVVWALPKLNAQVALFYKYTGALPGFTTIDGSLVETKIAGYQMLDLNFSKDIWEKRLHWTIGAKNLLNVQNITATTAATGVHSSSTGSQAVSWGRTVFTGLKFNFNTKP